MSGLGLCCWTYMTYTKQGSHRMLSCCLYICTCLAVPPPRTIMLPLSLLCSKAKFEKVNVVSVVTKNSKCLSLVSFLSSPLYMWSGPTFSDTNCTLHGCCPGAHHATAAVIQKC